MNEFTFWQSLAGSLIGSGIGSWIALRIRTPPVRKWCPECQQKSSADQCDMCPWMDTL